MVPSTQRKDPRWKKEWVVVKENWGTTARVDSREEPVSTAFGPLPEWVKEDDDGKVMSILAGIKKFGYSHASLDGYPWERARVEHSLSTIDAVPSDFSFI